MNSPSKYEFDAEEIIALYYFLRREPPNRHIKGLVEAINHVCSIAEHELATRDSETT